MANRPPAASRVVPTQEDLRRARLAHLERVAASRARMEAFNRKAEKNRARGTDRALQEAAGRFLEPGSGLATPAMLDLVRWPYAGARKAGNDVAPALRESILAEDEVCVWCRTAPSTTIDHVHPLDRGGSNHPLNLVGACDPCNTAKANFLPRELGWVLHLPLRAFAMAGR
ncbi:HNH endonuclease [Arthrobacter sp.]|uniref:HNH endonuclease n=1 Tax=Arthrobacter sp. TaxID=1667 RepID=UPI003A93C427